MIWNSIGVAYRLHWKLISNVDNIIKGNDIHIGSYDLCLEVKELNLKDGYENKGEISKWRVHTEPSNKYSSNLLRNLKFKIFNGKGTRLSWNSGNLLIGLWWSNSSNEDKLIRFSILEIRYICSCQCSSYKVIFGT